MLKKEKLPVILLGQLRSFANFKHSQREDVWTFIKFTDSNVTWIILKKNPSTRGGDTEEFKANIEGKSMRADQEVSVSSKQVQGQEKTPAFWEEKAGVTVLSNNKGGVMPDSVCA